MHETYSKLANFHVVDAEHLLFLAGTQFQGWYIPADEVEHGEDDASSSKRVSTAGERVGELVAELDPVVIEPAAIDRVEAVEMRNVITMRR